MIKIVYWLCKAGTAGLLALFTLNLLTYFYYNVGEYSLTPSVGTDFKYEANGFTSIMTEGFAMKRYDENGYANAANSVDYKMDILLMGGSHFDGYNVAANENVVEVLSNELKEQNMTVYNIGMSRHSLLVCANNLEEALERFAPNKYVVIETDTLELSDSGVEKVLTGEYNELSRSSFSGILYQIRRMPYMKLMWKQWLNIGKIEEENTENSRGVNYTYNY